jgi:hypothetical protein
LCFISGSYANGIIFKKDQKYYILTSNSINTGLNNNFIDVLINGKILLCASIFGIDKMSNLLITMINTAQSIDKYYQNASIINDFLNNIDYFNLDYRFDDIFNNNIYNGYDLYVVNHNKYNSPSIDKSIMINNRYYGDISNKSTIESILINHRFNSYEAGSLILDSDGKIVGCLTGAALNADISIDKNISIGLPSQFIFNFMITHINNLNTNYDITKTVAYNTNLLWSDINHVIKKSFLGISSYPLSINSPEMVDIYKLINKISGIFIDGFMEYYNNQLYKISFSKTYYQDVQYEAQIIFNPLLYGNELPYINSDPVLYKSNITPGKILILSITFYSMTIKDMITINLGKNENEFSISKFLYEYGPDNLGNYRDIIITYIKKDKIKVGEDESGNDILIYRWLTNNGIFYKETIKSKLVAYYQNDGINEGKTILIANKTLPKSMGNNSNINVYRYQINQIDNLYDLSSYTPILSNGRFPEIDVINNIPNILKSIIVYIISDVPGTIKLELYNNNELIVQAYEPSFGYKIFNFSIENSSTFKLYYQNGNKNQSYFKMETIIGSDKDIITQQTTQIPFPLIQKNAENFGQYIYSHYSNNELKNINSENYIL